MRLRFSYVFVTVLMLLALSVSLERKAYAYVDPGSGLLLLQGLGTVVTGVLFTLRKRIKALFVRSKSGSSQPAELPAKTTKIELS